MQALEQDLKRLALPEANTVFEAVRGRVISSDAFDIEPPGVAGLAVLVKAQTQLQSNLLDFLESLPLDRLGPWAAGGWEGVVDFFSVLAVAAPFGNPLKSYAESARA